MSVALGLDKNKKEYLTIMDIDIEQMKEVKSGKIDDEFFLWMDTNFGNFENGNILIEIEKYGNKYEIFS